MALKKIVAAAFIRGNTVCASYRTIIGIYMHHNVLSVMSCTGLFRSLLQYVSVRKFRVG